MADFPKPKLSDWQALAETETDGRAADLAWATPEGITVKPLYTAADLEAQVTAIADIFWETKGGRPS